MRSRPIPALLLLAACSSAPDPADPRVAAVADGLLPAVVVRNEPVPPRTLAQAMAQLHVPGVSIAVADSGRIVWARGFGVLEAGTEDSVTAATLFQAASISKPVAATAMLRLVEEGRLSLDEPVNRYLTSWQLPENELTAAEKVTLRRIASHSAGLTVHGFPGYAVGASLPTVPQILDGAPPANTAAVRVDLVPGTEGRYSGGGVTVMQLVMTDVTGEPFPALMQRLVLGPLGMSESAYEQPLPGALADRAARGHDGDGRPIEGRWHVYPELAAAGLWTTPTDLLKWAVGIADARAGGEDAILSQATAREMLTVQMEPFGLGLQLGGTGSDFNFGHGGANDGFRAQLIYFPETGQGAAVMTNGDQGGRLAGDLLRTIAQVHGWPGMRPTEITRLDTDLAPYAGRFHTDEPQPADATITVEGGKLFIEIDPFVPKGEIVLVEPDRAIYVDEAGPLEFLRDAEGKVRAIRVGGRVTLDRVP